MYVCIYTFTDDYDNIIIVLCTSVITTYQDIFDHVIH